MTTTLSDVLNASKPRTQKVKICVDGGLQARQAELEEDLAQSMAANRDKDTLGGDKKSEKIAKQIDALQKEAEKHSYTFEFASIGTRAWTDLIAKHPPTGKQREDARRNKERVADFNPDTFPHAAISKSLISINGDEIEISVSDAKDLFDKWNFASWLKLWNACQEANLGDNSLGKSALASMALGRFEQKSEQLSDSESPDPSSSDE